MYIILTMICLQVAMCNFPTVKDAADVAIATMLSGIQVIFLLRKFSTSLDFCKT